MHLALLTQSPHVNAHDASLIARALAKQLRNDVAPAWGMLAPSVSFYADPMLVPDGADRLWLIESPDVADALGYHDQDPYGQPYGRVFVAPILDSGGAILAGDNSVSVTASHEACELFGDPECNRWAQRPDGSLVALELCDAVEGDSYPVSLRGGESVSVSNFVTPAWFDQAPEAGASYDRLGKLSAPWTMTDGGYLIVMRGGRVSQEFANAPLLASPAKRHPAARTARRMKAERLLGQAFPGTVG